jgi:predicted permease
VLLGVAVGATPLSALMLPAGTASAAAAGMALRPPPLELALFAAAARCCADAAALLGDAALPIGTLVLATALSPPQQQPASTMELRELGVNASSSSSAVSDASAALMAGGARGAAVAALVRLLLLPAACVVLGAAASRAGLLPADPALRLVLLAQSAMPSAQNLVLLLALRKGTAAAAPRFAAQLLRQYAVAALPVAAWMSLFVRIVQ